VAQSEKFYYSMSLGLRLNDCKKIL